MRRVIFLFLIFYCWTIFLSPIPASAQEIFLVNGDRVTGEVTEATDTYLKVMTEGMGEIQIAREFIREEAAAEEHLVPAPPPPPPAPEEKAVKVEKVWKGSVSAGINARQGNTNSESASARANVNRRKGLDESGITGDFYYSSFRRRMTSLKLNLLARHDRYFRSIDRGAYALGRFEAENDRFAEINQRLTPAAGLGYAWANTEDFKLKLEAAAGFSQTNFADNTVNRFEGVLIPRFFFEKRFFGRSRFWQDLTVYSSLSDSGEYRLRSETVLELPIIERLVGRLSVIDEYNSAPGNDAVNNDIRFISSVAYYL